MSCKKFDEYISMEIDGNITDEKLDELKRHCQICKQCRENRAKSKRIYSVCSEMKSPAFDATKLKYSIISAKKFNFKSGVFGISASAAVVLIVLLSASVLNTYNSHNKSDIIKVVTVEDSVLNEQTATEIYDKSAVPFESPSENEFNALADTAVIDDKKQTESSNSFGSYNTEASAEYDTTDDTEYRESAETSIDDFKSNTTVDAAEYDTTNGSEFQESVEIPIDDIKPSSGGGSGSGGSSSSASFENIVVVSSERYREQIINVLYSNSVSVENMNKNFTANMSNECFSNIVNELNLSSTEFAVSKIPDARYVIVSFEFKEESDETEESEESETE